MAEATSIATISAVTVRTKKARFISCAASFVSQQPPLGCSAGQNYDSPLYGAHRQNYLIGVPIF